jgi:hypothetical protein
MSISVQISHIRLELAKDHIAAKHGLSPIVVQSSPGRQTAPLAWRPKLARPAIVPPQVIADYFPLSC